MISLPELAPPHTDLDKIRRQPPSSLPSFSPLTHSPSHPLNHTPNTPHPKPPTYLTMSPTTYVVTGSNRGIGLELVKRLLATEPEARVVAAARSPDEADELLAVVRASEGRAATLKLDLVSRSLIALSTRARSAADCRVCADGPRGDQGGRCRGGRARHRG